MQRIPEPEHSEWAARLRELARRDADELIPRPPFAIYGLAEPAMTPIALAETERENGVWRKVTLAHGNRTNPAGPYVSVRSTVPSADTTVPGAESDLLSAIDHERNRIAAHAGIDDDDPPEPAEHSQATLRLGDHEADAEVCVHGNVWAARTKAGRVNVMVTCRGVEIDTLCLTPVADLEPYLQGRNEMIGELSHRHRSQPPPELEPAEGVAAYRALAEASLDQQARILTALNAGREPRTRAGEGAVTHALWQRAVREQTRISGIDSRQANELVTQVVNHLTKLDTEAQWFSAQPRLRAAAIDETLRFAVLGHDVPSRAAQQAWVRYWSHHMSLLPPETDSDWRAKLFASQQLIADWLQAWSVWAGGD
jgi:hypothetical protein